MDMTEFDPDKRLGEGIGKMRRQELCALVSELCTRIRSEEGEDGYRGGVYPENISLSEDGAVAIGPGKRSDWEGQELRFIAPELYWGGKLGSPADVYSLGMLLYYGATGGKLPFDGESEEQARVDRMNGKTFAVPTVVPRALREIIIKATAFKASDRYQTVEELQARVDSCMQNKYLKGEPSSQALFQKEDRELSDLERIMVSIIDEENGEDTRRVKSQAEKTPEADGQERTEEGELPKLGTPPEKRQEDPAIQAAEDEEMERLRQLFNAPYEEPPLNQGVVPEIQEEAAQETLEPVPLAMGTEEGDVRVYEPIHGRRESKSVERQPIPILTVESNPELAPVVPSAQVLGAAGTKPPINRSAQVAQEVQKRRRRPVAVVLILCALLIISAIVANAMLTDSSWHGTNRPATVIRGDGDASGTVSVPTAPPVEESVEVTEAPFDYSTLDPETEIDTQGNTHEIAQQAAMEHRYEVISANDSWTEARDACIEKGGYLAVISTEEEFNRVIEMVQESGLSRVWLGCHRVDGSLVWEKADEVLYYPWDVGEPSYEDAWDGVDEDYLLLWYHNGWVYNDSRNDPAADYPEWYVGTIGYVCEYDE